MRKNELEKHKAIWLTKEAYDILRKEKKRLISENQGKSMMAIINNLIINKYKDENMLLMQEKEKEN